MKRNGDLIMMLEVMSKITHEMTKLNTSELSFDKMKEIVTPIIKQQMKQQLKMQEDEMKRQLDEQKKGVIAQAEQLKVEKEKRRAEIMEKVDEYNN